MPEPLKSVDKQTGHRTKAERAAREKAEESMTRKSTTRMRAPAWLSDAALEEWRFVLRRAKGIELLDPLDTTLLAVYCDAAAKYRQASEGLVVIGKDGEPVASDDAIKSRQSCGRRLLQYADKLGLSRSARARLAKRRADDTLDTFGEEFDG